MAINIIILSIIALVLNIIFGIYRARFPKMTIRWWLMIHASIPIIIPLRIWLNTPKIVIPLFIGLAITGQILGNKIAKSKKADNEEEH